MTYPTLPRREDYMVTAPDHDPRNQRSSATAWDLA